MYYRILFLFLMFVTVFGEPATGSEVPNILWITSEDHGPHLGCYGDAIARTPDLDALAHRGMLFKRAWSCAPVCAPARTAIITGLYPSSSGGLHMRSMVKLPREIVPFPKLLREAGYYCTNNSKEDYNVSMPDGVWDDSSAKGHWRQRPGNKSFFAVFNSTKSHESQLRGRPFELITDPATVRVPEYHPDRPEVRRDWARYYDIVSLVDQDAGNRLKELATDGLADNTIVFYFSDHGCGMPRSKRWPSNSGLHVPMIVYFPERWQHLAPPEYKAGGQSDRLVNFVDLAPTMLSLAGIQPPAWMQGYAFGGRFVTPPQEFLFGERGRMDERPDLARSVTDGRYVYMRNYFLHVSQGQHVSFQFQTPTTNIWRAMFDRGLTNPAQSVFWKVPKAPEELYDLQSDPDEVRNLADNPAHRQTLERFRTAQQRHAAAVRDVCFLPEGEIHSRAVGRTPYEMARDEEAFPFKRVFVVAELSAREDAAGIRELKQFLTYSDSAVRYWAAMGLLNRGRAAIDVSENELRQALADESAYVRIAAAQSLVQFGSASNVTAALDVLRAASEPSSNGVLVSIAALNAIETLGDKAASLREFVRGIDPKGPSPDARYNEYVPRLIKSILGE